MIGKEIENEENITLPEARETLQQRESELEDEEELNYEQKVTLEYLNKIGDKDPERTKKALEELKDIGISEKPAIKLINLMPTQKDQIRLVFEKERTDIDEDQIKKTLKIIKDLREA